MKLINIDVRYEPIRDDKYSILFIILHLKQYVKNTRFGLKLDRHPFPILSHSNTTHLAIIFY